MRSCTCNLEELERARRVFGVSVRELDGFSSTAARGAGVHIAPLRCVNTRIDLWAPQQCQEQPTPGGESVDKPILTVFVYLAADGKHYASWDRVPPGDTITVVFSKTGDDINIVRRAALGEARRLGIGRVVNLDDDRSLGNTMASDHEPLTGPLPAAQSFSFHRTIWRLSFQMALRENMIPFDTMVYYFSIACD